MDIAHRIFDASSQVRFAALSRDFNPIHMDAIRARRTQAGAPIVHGIHSLLFLLESIAASDDNLPNAASLKAQFTTPIYIGDEGKVEILQVTPKTLRARLVIEGREAVTASIAFGERAEAAAPHLTQVRGVPMNGQGTPNELRLDEMPGRTGCLSFTAIVAETAKMFPAAACYLGARRIAALVCSSYLVGMVVPGLHSLFAGIETSFFAEIAAANALEFSVRSVKPRHRLVRIAIRGPGLHGSLETMSRIPPVMQPSMASVEMLVAKDEFQGSTALIVGGSRGLGELTAKLIAAGGGRVVITYTTGKEDAAAVSEEIRKAGAECETVPYDVRRAAAGQLSGLGELPTHVYYFATPPIFRHKAGLCDLRRLAEFNSFYIVGFLDLVQTCLRRRPEGIRVFYPSSVAVTSRPGNMTEYAMSKAAAEILCADMQNYLPNASVLTRRLPRLPTDQTGSVVQVETADPLAVILPIVREMHTAPHFL